jgi:lysophospholipid acyltransferase (LPLAT)-like uncharacterized protein
MRIRSRRLTKLVAWLVTAFCRTLFATCRKELYPVGDDPNLCPYRELGSERYLFSVWHDHILAVLFSGRPRDMAGLVSKHQDGSYVAETMKLNGVLPVRGSTNRGGTEALRRMIEVARDRHIAITPDGPRGPRRRAKPGIVFLASHSGRKIVPIGFACRRAWRIRGNWTDMLVPKPFTKIIAVGGPAIAVPPNLTRAQQDEYVRLLDRRMEELDDYAARLLAGDPPVQPKLAPVRRAA